MVYHEVLAPRRNAHGSPDSPHSRSNPSHPWIRSGIWLGWMSTFLASLAWTVQQAYPAWRHPSDLTRCSKVWSLLQNVWRLCFAGSHVGPRLSWASGFLALSQGTRAKQFQSLREVWRTESRRGPVPPFHRRRAKPPLVPSSSSWSGEVPQDADPLA